MIKPPSDPVGYDPSRIPAHLELQYEELESCHWSAEMLTNCISAGATQVYFALEPQGVQTKNVYRRCIVDNGAGMTKKMLIDLFGAIGRSGKSTNGLHEFFGMGAKMSLWPWNNAGVIIASWVDGVGHMVWIEYDDRINQYARRSFVMGDDSLEVAPLIDPNDGVDPETGIDYHVLKSLGGIIQDNGTVVVLLGDSENVDQDTILGDLNKGENTTLNSLSQYLNLRFWDTMGVDIVVDCLRSHDKSMWHYNVANKSLKRRVHGAKSYVMFKSAPGSKSGNRKLVDHGVVNVTNATIEYFFSDEVAHGVIGKRSNEARRDAMILVEYKNEIYESYNHAATFLMFGVNYSSVRQRLVLVIHPDRYGEPGGGVFSPLSRKGLDYRSGPGQEPESVPLHMWGSEFRNQMPKSIYDALKLASKGGPKSNLKGEAKIRAKATNLLQKMGLVPVVGRSNGSVTGPPAGKLGKKKKKKKKKSKGSNGNGTGSSGNGNGTGSSGNGKGVNGTNGTRGTYDPSVLNIPDGRVVSSEDLGTDNFHLANFIKGALDDKDEVLLNGDHPRIQELVKSCQHHYDVEEHENVAHSIQNGLVDDLRVAVVVICTQYLSTYSRDTIEERVLTPSCMSSALLSAMMNTRRTSEYLQGLRRLV